MNHSPSRPEAPSLPSSSYAILGMLALRSWSAYELTQQMRRGLIYCLPTAESVLYNEPKRLVKLGLAAAKTQPVGTRSRTVYSITAKGRRVLTQWLATAPQPPRLEVPVMLRLLYADQAGKDDLLRAIGAARSWALERAPEALVQVQGYLTDGGPFPDRVHINALFARFFVDLFEAMTEWCDFAEDQIQTWPSTADLGMSDDTRSLLLNLESRLEALAKRADQDSDPRNRP